MISIVKVHHIYIQLDKSIGCRMVELEHENSHISRAAFAKKIIFNSLLLLARPFNVFEQTLH